MLTSTLKTERCHDANFVVTAGCRCEYISVGGEAILLLDWFNIIDSGYSVPLWYFIAAENVHVGICIVCVSFSLINLSATIPN